MWSIAARLLYTIFLKQFFQGYSTPNFQEVLLIKASSLDFRLTSIVFTSTSYNYEAIQHILFRGYSTPSFGRVIAHQTQSCNSIQYNIVKYGGNILGVSK